MPGIYCTIFVFEENVHICYPSKFGLAYIASESCGIFPTTIPKWSYKQAYMDWISTTPKEHCGSTNNLMLLVLPLMWVRNVVILIPFWKDVSEIVVSRT